MRGNEAEAEAETETEAGAEAAAANETQAEAESETAKDPVLSRNHARARTDTANAAPLARDLRIQPHTDIMDANDISDNARNSLRLRF